MADVKLNSLKFPNLPDRYILDAGKVEYHEADTFEEDTVGKALQNKAEVDGSYESMTVGNAEQLVSNVRVNDKTPYLFRTSGGSVDIGDREYVNGIVGGTVAWNQYIKSDFSSGVDGWQGESGSFMSFSASNGILTATYGGGATATYQMGVKPSPAVVPFVKDHKVLVTVDINVSRSGGYALRNSDAFGSGNLTILTSGDAADTWHRKTKIVNVLNNSNYYAYFLPTGSASNYSDGDTFKFKNHMIIDLTQMFGSTIADYIYSLETTTSGAGVAWFKKLFNKPYYAYNAGELKSVSGLVSHDMTGFNQLNTENAINATNIVSANNNGTITIKDVSTAQWSNTYIGYSDVIAGQTYEVCGIMEYGRLGGSISSTELPATSPKTYPDTSLGESIISVINRSIASRTFISNFTGRIYWWYCADSEISYHKVFTFSPCVHLRWDGSRDGEYEPYVKHSYPLDSDLTLRGIPKLDANNNLYYDGDTYEADGTVTRKYAVVDLGTLTWGYDTTGTYPFFRSNDLMGIIKNVTANSAVGNMLCSRYKTTDANTPYAGNATNCICEVTFGQIQVYDTAYTDASAFKTAMNGVYLVYELAEPTTETADPYQQTQIVNDFGTEEYVISDGTFAVPVGSDTDYPVNLVAKLEMAPNSPDGSGDYIVRQTNGVNEYVPLVIEDALPTIPSTAGTYTLTVTVAEGSDPVLAWTQA